MTHLKFHLPFKISWLIRVLGPPFAAFLLQWLLWPVIKPNAWLLFYPAVFFSSWLADRRGGIVAVVFSAFLAWWFFVPPRFFFEKGDFKQFLPAFIFIGIGVLFSLFHDRVKKTSLRLGKLLAAIIDSASNAIVIRTLEGVITTWNRGAERLFGYKAEEIIGQPFSLLCPANRAHETSHNLSLIQKGKRIAPFETVRIRKDGMLLLVTSTIYPIEGEEGKIIGASHIINDISERKRADERFSLVVETAPFGMILVNQKGEIILINSYIERSFGYERNELLGRPLDILIPERYRAKHAGYQESFFHETRPRPMGIGRNLFGRHKNGDEIPVEIALTPLKTLEGPLVMASVVDITERKRTEKLEIAMAKAVELDKVKDEFLNMAAHELRTPLTAIKEGTEIILEGLDGPINVEVAEDLRMVKKNTERLTRLVNEVLDLQTLKAGRMNFHKKPVNVNKLIQRVGKNYTLVAEKKNLKLVSQLDEREAVVFCDEDKITQVLVNLIGNAVKFTEHGQVTIRASKTAANLRVSVHDEGPGIREEDKQKLFQSFSQLGNAKSNGKEGSGLGLAISKKIIEGHQGVMGVESEAGHGSTFYFMLPLKPKPSIESVPQR